MALIQEWPGGKYLASVLIAQRQSRLLLLRAGQGTHRQ